MTPSKEESAVPGAVPPERRSFHRESTRQLLDDRIGQSDEKIKLVTRLVSSLHKQRFFLFSSLVPVVAWSCLCAWGAVRLQEKAESEPGGSADNWMAWIEGAGNKFRLIGYIFSFHIVFRFNRCYDRWLKGRVIWGDIITVSLDVTRTASKWIVDDEYLDRFSRFVVVFAYATKALLRGKSLADPDEDGEELIERGYLTREELVDMDNDEGWQPHYCLDMLDFIWIEAQFPDKALMFDVSHKVYPQLFRAIDGATTTLGACLGGAIRLRASGLPELYDGLHHMIFYFYFILAPVFFAPSLGWALPIIIALEALLIMFIISMGSDMVEPFGTDRVDLPLELFCETIEVQTELIRERGKRDNLKRLARTSNARATRSLRPKSTMTARSIIGDSKY